MTAWSVIFSLITLVLGALIGHKLTEHRERKKAERESARSRAEREEAARVADEHLRHAIATSVNSARSRLEPLFHSVRPDRPATPEQVERIAETARDFLRYVERLHELRDEDLRRRVHMWYFNLARAADDLEHLSHSVDDFGWIEHEHLRKTKHAYAISRQHATRRRLQALLDDGAQLELIGSV